MKKALIIAIAALASLVLLSSCNSPKMLAKKTFKKTCNAVDDMTNLVERFDKLSTKEKKQFVDELSKQDYDKLAEKVEELSSAVITLGAHMATVDEDDIISEEAEERFEKIGRSYEKKLRKLTDLF